MYFDFECETLNNSNFYLPNKFIQISFFVLNYPRIYVTIGRFLEINFDLNQCQISKSRPRILQKQKKKKNKNAKVLSPFSAIETVSALF